MKRVLLCSPFVKGDLFEHRFVTPPLGVHRIASFLRKHGHMCTVYDSSKPNNFIVFDDLVKNIKWDYIGFSSLSATEEYDIAKMFRAKELSPNSILVAGGSGAALNYQFILDKTPIDIVVLAEGEFPMLDLCNDVKWQDIDGIVFRKKAKILTNEDYWEISKDLDIESMEADCYWKRTASYYDDPNYSEINTFRLFTANYCPLSCHFCTLTLWRKHSSGCVVPVVQLSPEQILQMVYKVIVSYKEVKQIFFVNDDFFLIKGHGEKFCELAIEAKEKGFLPKEISFIALTNIIRINKHNLKLMKEAGFRLLSIGIESTSQFVLDSLNKKQTEEQIWKNTDLIIKAGIKCYVTLLLFTPFGRLEDLIKDLNGFRELSTRGCGLSLEPFLIPLKGTTLAEEGVPESTRWIQIEGTDLKINKGFAWLPIDPKVREIFYKFEEIYPRFKAWRFNIDTVKHHEKSYQSTLILDCLEFVLRKYFDIKVIEETLLDLNHIESEISKFSNVKAVDIVGDFIEESGGK